MILLFSGRLDFFYKRGGCIGISKAYLIFQILVFCISPENLNIRKRRDVQIHDKKRCHADFLYMTATSFFQLFLLFLHVKVKTVFRFDDIRYVVNCEYHVKLLFANLPAVQKIVYKGKLVDSIGS
jgi:hypothetical protein